MWAYQRDVYAHAYFEAPFVIVEEPILQLEVVMIEKSKPNRLGTCRSS